MLPFLLKCAYDSLTNFSMHHTLVFIHVYDVYVSLCFSENQDVLRERQKLNFNNWYAIDINHRQML